MSVYVVYALSIKFWSIKFWRFHIYHHYCTIGYVSSVPIVGDLTSVTLTRHRTAGGPSCPPSVSQLKRQIVVEHPRATVESGKDCLGLFLMDWAIGLRTSSRLLPDCSLHMIRWTLDSSQSDIALQRCNCTSDFPDPAARRCSGTNLSFQLIIHDWRWTERASGVSVACQGYRGQVPDDWHAANVTDRTVTAVNMEPPELNVHPIYHIYPRIHIPT